jgi:hypothetical protein
MALTQVTGPYPIFTDLDGTPLDDGYLYIGEINQDPEQNPIQVFFDANLTIPATQPIRTSNGYAYRNGTPALIYTAGEFSITIRNKRQEFVLYSPVGYGFDPAAVSASVVKNDFTGDGVEVDFVLSASPSTILATNVFINGVYQEKDSYTLSGNTITFSIAPPLNSSIEIMTNETGIINAGNATAISYTASLAGATAQTVQTKLEQYVSVKDFGAVGDGVADDTAAIQAAIDTERGVFLPKGTYLVTSSLTITYNGARLYGEDQYDTIIKAPTNSDFTILKIGVAGGTYGQYGNVTLDNFRIDGSRSSGSPSTNSKGIETLWAAHIRMNNVRVTNTRGYGVEFYTGGYSSITNCNFTAHGITGLYLNGVSSTDAITSTLVQSCQISSNGTYGIHAKNFFNITLDANIIEDIGTGGVGAAIKLEGADLRNMSIIHNYFEANNDAAYDIDAGSVGIQGLSIQDNWLAGTPATSTYNFSGATLVNAIVQGNEGGDSVVSALSDEDGIRSLELLGVTQIDTSAELTTSTTGGFSQDVAEVTISAGVWIIEGVLQTNNSVGANAVAAGIALSNAAGQSGKQVATNVNFQGTADYTESFSAQEQARLQFTSVISVTAPTTSYMAAYIDISAGTLAYKAQLRAIRIA